MLALLPSAASADKQQLQATGTGTYLADTSVVDFDFGALVDAPGAPAAGQFDFRMGEIGFVFAGEINTLEVAGSVATMCGVVTEASQDVFIGWDFKVAVEDNGPGGEGDRLNPGRLGEPGTDTCAQGVPEDAWTPIISGDIVVRGCDEFKDTPDTDKDKCKSKQH
jgi:hypothetical protein